jgi:hypothetical protein
MLETQPLRKLRQAAAAQLLSISSGTELIKEPVLILTVHNHNRHRQARTIEASRRISL